MSLELIVGFILTGTTLQMVVLKNNLDRRWNENYGHRFGDYCFLCVSFWVNFCMVGIGVLWFDIAQNYQLVFLIFGPPSGIMFLLKKYQQ